MPPAKKKVETVDADLAQDAPEVDAPETPETSGAPNEGETDVASGAGDELEVLVNMPCPKHFPDGWPSQEPGAHANCPHDFGIAFGEHVMISKERALELGFELSE